MMAAMPTHNVFGLTDRQLADFVTSPLRIAAIFLVALVLRFLVGRVIRRTVRTIRDGRVNKRLHALGEKTPLLIVDMSEVAIDRRRARAATLGALLTSVANFVIVAVAVVTVLGQVGIDLGPILASAGIIGVAVGFGAQNLVKDFLSGLFLVLEDTYSVGDTVDIGPATGTVEIIGLRSTRIRDVHGTLWSVRNGAIVRVANYSQLWQRALFDTLVVRSADVERARAAILAAALEVAAEDRWAGVALEPPAVWGVNEVRENGIVLRLAVKRRTGHDDFDRALRERVLHDLDELGVRQFPILAVTVADAGADPAAGSTTGAEPARTPAKTGGRPARRRPQA